MADEEVKANEVVKKRGRPTKAKTTNTVSEEATNEIKEETTIKVEEPIEIVEEPIIDTEITLDDFTQQFNESTTIKVDTNTESDEIIEVEEIIDETEGYTLNYKFHRGETVWVANWGHKLEVDTFGFAQDIWKFRPLKLTIKSVILEEKLGYKFYSYDKFIEESHVKKSYDLCKALCEGLNS